jgi:hypothetical protein
MSLPRTAAVSAALALLLAATLPTPARAQAPAAPTAADSIRAAKLGPRPAGAPRWEYAEYKYDLSSNRHGWAAPGQSVGARGDAAFAAAIGVPVELLRGGESRLFTALGEFGWELVSCQGPKGYTLSEDVRRCLFKRRAAD